MRPHAGKDTQGQGGTCGDAATLRTSGDTAQLHTLGITQAPESSTSSVVDDEIPSPETREPQVFEIYTPEEGEQPGFDFFEVPCSADQPRTAAVWECKAIGKFVQRLNSLFGVSRMIVVWEKRLRGNTSDILFKTADGGVAASDIKKNTPGPPPCPHAHDGFL